MKLIIQIPCYNEEKTLPETIADLPRHIEGIDKIEYLVINDGSKDKTWSIIEELSAQSPYATGIKLAKNAGHQNAVMAGLMTVKDLADCVISIDADLQDDINVIPQFIQEFQNGNDIVYGVRNKRDTDTFFKRGTALFFYKFMKKMGVNIVYNHADYRLMSRRALDAFAQFPEVNLFLRGMVPLVGYRSANVYYDRHERFAGESKYPFKKMLELALNGITSFSITPIKLVTLIGFLCSVVSVIAAIYSVVVYFMGRASVGWSSTFVSIWFIGGLQLLALGLIGEYIGKIYKEVKGRPRFIVETFLDDKK